MENIDKYLKDLITKYLDGTCTPEEEEILLRWYAESGEPADYTGNLPARKRKELEDDIFGKIIESRRRGTAKQGLFTTKTRTAVLGVAASVLLIATAVPIARYFLQSQMTLHTTYGEVKTIILPDSSNVVLNGNSSLSYGKQGGNQSDREVWLTGEASFNVRHMKDDQRFVVHLSDTLSINVIGTEFTVRKRPAETLIALKSGKIKLHYHQNGAAERHIEMKPNDVVTFRQADRGYRKEETAHIADYFAWEEQKMALTQTSLAHLQKMLIETYGVQITVTDERMLQRRASGSIPTSGSYRQLIRNLAELYGLEIIEHRNDKNFVLRSRGHPDD